MCEKECVVGQESGVLRSQELIGGEVDLSIGKSTHFESGSWVICISV